MVCSRISKEVGELEQGLGERVRDEVRERGWGGVLQHLGLVGNCKDFSLFFFPPELKELLLDSEHELIWVFRGVLWLLH